MSNRLVLNRRASIDYDAIRVVSRRSDGRGGVIEHPISVETRGVIGARTDGLTLAEFDVSDEMFEEVLLNFRKTNGPLGIYWTHDEKGRRSEGGKPPMPAAAFVEAVWRDGDQLWARLDLGPTAWNLVVEERGIRGFSFEVTRDEETVTGDVHEGWSLTGGIYTNFPALNVRIAAEAPKADRDEGEEMADKVTLESLTADVAKLAADLTARDEKIATLTTANAELTGKLEAHKQTTEKLTAERVTLETLKAENVTLAKRVDELKTEQIVRDVHQLRVDSVAAGKSAAFFEGSEKDPIGYLEEMFGGSFPRMKAAVARLESRPFATRTGSGSATSAGDPEEALQTEAKRIASEKGVSFGDALGMVRSQKPEVWRAAMEARERRSIPAGSE